MIDNTKMLEVLCCRGQPSCSCLPLKGLQQACLARAASAIEAVRANIRLATTKNHASQTSWETSLELISSESSNKLKPRTQSE